MNEVLGLTDSELMARDDDTCSGRLRRQSGCVHNLANDRGRF